MKRVIDTQLRPCHLLHMNCGDIIGSYQLETALAGFPSAWCARHMATGQLFQLAVQQVDVNEPKILAVMKDVANFQNDVFKPVLEFGVLPDVGIWTISELEERPPARQFRVGAERRPRDVFRHRAHSRCA